jgi:(2R)-ethylmalonyl-CoA mutase
MMQTQKDQPWLFRTYAGHSTAAASNELYRGNLAKGQTGLSVAFDLPTQTGYDSDHILSRGEVGKVGVPIGHLGDMRTLFSGIPLETMNTSMTINAPAAWLLALYVALNDLHRYYGGWSAKEGNALFNYRKIITCTLILQSYW